MADSNSPLLGNKTTSGPTLARTMGLWALIMYGVGDMLGSGIYALIGKVAGTMGNAAWLAFIASMVAAALTGLSFAALCSRYPRAAGEAYITQRAFQQPFLSYLIGLAVVASGLTSLATQSHAFARYLYGLTHEVSSGGMPRGFLWLTAIAFILVLSFINFWGMRQSIWLNILCTIVEVAGLIFIVIVGMKFWGSVNYLQTPPPPQSSDLPGSLSATLVLQGAVLTFYSFIGFEDMINVAEEVKNPRRNLPIAILVALAITTVIYIAVSITAVSVMHYSELKDSPQPLVDVVRNAAPWFKSEIFSYIALFAIINTGLLNYIMGSRLVYGMAKQGLVPRSLGKVHPTRRTPYVAIAALMCIVIVLALYAQIGELAAATSGLLLFVFMVVNASLIVVKRMPDEPKGTFHVPDAVPFCGILVCAAILLHTPDRALKIGFLILVGITMLFLIARPRNLTAATLAAGEEEA